MGVKITVSPIDPASQLKLQEHLDAGKIVESKVEHGDGSFTVNLVEAVNFTM